MSDPDDGRRTLVREAPGGASLIRSKVDVPIDQAIAQALASEDSGDLSLVIEALELLSLRLTPRVLNRSPEEIVS